MTITIEVAPERESYLRRQAELSGLTLDQFAQRTLNEAADALAATGRTANRLDAAGSLKNTPESRANRVAHFREWAYSHDRNTPLLTDEEISREAMYARDTDGILEARDQEQGHGTTEGPAA